MLSELVKRLDCIGRNICIDTIAIVFVESRYYLPISNNNLANTQFANARQPISVNNKQDIQRSIVTLYKIAALRIKKTRALAYYKIDSAILWFVNTTSCYRKMILAYFMCTKLFRQMKHSYCCNNCMYKRIPLGNTSVFKF